MARKTIEMHDTTAGTATDVSVSGRRKARQSAQRNSRRVRNLKIILPLVSLLIAATVLFMTLQFRFVPGLQFESTSISMDGLVMTDPKLSGNNENSSYNVVAKRAVQRLSNPDLIDLENIHAQIVQIGGNAVSFTSNMGIYDSNTDFLSLSENIEVIWSNGYSIHLESAEIDLKNGIIRSQNKILVESSNSELSAGNVEISEDEKKLKFTDGVIMTIQPQAGREEK